MNTIVLKDLPTQRYTTMVKDMLPFPNLQGCLHRSQSSPVAPMPELTQDKEGNRSIATQTMLCKPTTNSHMRQCEAVKL